MAMINTEETKFSVMCSLFDWIQRTKPSPKKRAKFRKFLDNFCGGGGGGYFPAIRLLLPALDRERGSYGLKESVLAASLVDAVGISRDSADARRLLNWRKDSAAPNAGNFALVAAEILRRRQASDSAGLSVGDLNRMLDRLAAAKSRTERTSVLEALIANTNALEMKWIIMIILKDLKLGISEKSIFHEFHPDAEDLFNVTCDLRLVCEKLKDRTQRHKRQDIEVGKAVRPQLAMRVADAATAWKKLHGKEVVVECKLDGDRIQIHKSGNEIHYYSRNFLDHSEYSHGMSNIIVQNVLTDRCILDGEMLVWDTSLNRFTEFGSNQEIAKASRDGFDSDRQLCYVAFDILYVGDTSVIHRSLKERHELLRKFVKPLKGRLDILVPDGGLDAHRYPGEPCCSFIAHNVDDVEKFFKETIDNREEGIVLKDLGSKWEPSDRSGKWLKLKPDYVRAGSDLDALIIGGYYGSGRRGGEIAQFLVGLAERPAPNTYPRRFISFCRVGTGLSDEELDAVVNKLKPFLRKYEYPKKSPPSFYQVTNNSKERPDVWVDSPENSIILSITSDIRTIRSEVFAAPYSLRFPRIDRVRYDKPWHECLDVQSFIELVHTSNGTTQRGLDSGGGQSRQKQTKSVSKEKKKLSVVPSHLVHTDISGVKGDTEIFSEMMFYFANVPATHLLDSLHKLVAENGGTFSMNLNNSVTHCVAAESKGMKYQAAKRHGDIIHYSWVLDCCSKKKLVPLQPKYFLFLSDSSKKKLQEEVDEFSDSYYWDLDLADIKQLLNNVNRMEDEKAIDHYKTKYCPPNFSRFNGCSIYLHALLESLKLDIEALLGLTLQRLKIEVQMNGGQVSENLSKATHLVVLWVPGFTLDMETLLKSFTGREKLLLSKGRLHVVQSQWLEDSMESNQRLPEEMYGLKPMLEQLSIDYSEHEMNLEASSPQDNAENQNLTSSSNKEGSSALKETGSTRKSRRVAAGKSMNKRKGVSNQTQRRTRARTITRKPAKISGNESINSVSDEENRIKEEEDKEPEESQEISCVNKGQGVPMRAQRTRPRIGKNKKPAELSGQDSDGNTFHEMKNENKPMEVDHDERNIDEDILKASETKGVEDSEPPKSSYGKDVRHWFSKSPETKMASEKHIDDNDGKNSPAEKLEVMTDPVHAMLLDMIPRLGKEKVEGTSTGVEDKKLELDAKATEPKKKKVSYKELAAQLLYDF